MFENRINKYGLVKWKDLIPLQNDNLKSTTDEEFKRLEKSFENNGNISVLHVWDNKGKLYLLDGVGRKQFFEKKEQEGIKIPEKVPCIFIDFKNKREALKAILVYSSQYRTINEDGLVEFLNTNNLLNYFPDMLKELELPNIDLEKLDLDLDDTDPDMDDEDVSLNEKVKHYFSKEKMSEAFLEDFPKFKTLEEFTKLFVTKSFAMSEFNRLCSGYKSGGTISLLFNPQRHLVLNKKSSKWSFFEGFKQEFFRKMAVKFLLDFDRVHLPCRVPHRLTGGIGNTAHVADFQPYLARDIYKYYCKDGAKILDPCAGWGGRMLGVYSSLLKDSSYIATDPCKETYNGLLKLNDFLKGSGLKINVKLINDGFENVKLKPNTYDFAFTSPPYFDTEQYSTESTQSYMKFNNYENWVSGFLTPLILNTIKALKNDSVFLLNVGNKKYDLLDRVRQICCNNNLFCEVNQNFRLYKNVGLRASESEEDGEVFIEIKRKK